MEIEDHLQDSMVFVSGFDGRRAHSDSYMTLVDFPALDRALLTDVFTPEEWLEAAEYWATNENMQPPLRLVSMIAKRRFVADVLATGESK